MTRVQHATTAPISGLDRVPFLGAARVRLERMVLSLTDPPGRAQHINYLEPAGNPGIFGPDSVSWRVLSNPVTVFIGGVTAVLFELAEPRVRSGVWDHTDFRHDPVARMQRAYGVAATRRSIGQNEYFSPARTHNPLTRESCAKGTSPAAAGESRPSQASVSP